METLLCMTFAGPIIHFFPDFSGKELFSGSESEEDESLEVKIKCEKLKPNM